MRKILLISLMSLFIIPGLNLPVQADTAITRITTDFCEDGFPQIKGDYVVWQRYLDGDWEIFLYDLQTGLTRQITNNDYDDISPRTDGQYLTWMGCVNPGGEIFVHSIADEQTTQITTDTNADTSPQIADARVVWTSCAITSSIEPGKIILYDIAAETSWQLNAGNLDNSSPKINSDSVIWIETDQNDNSTLFVYDISEGTTEPAREGLVWKDSPQTDGDLTVSMTNDGTDWEILVRDNGHQKGVEQITDNSENDTYPRIAGSYITWMGGEGRDAEIYLASYADASPPPLPTSDIDGDGDTDGSDFASFVRNFVLSLFSAFAEKFGTLN